MLLDIQYRMTDLGLFDVVWYSWYCELVEWLDWVCLTLGRFV